MCSLPVSVYMGVGVWCVVCGVCLWCVCGLCVLVCVCVMRVCVLACVCVRLCAHLILNYLLSSSEFWLNRSSVFLKCAIASCWHFLLASLTVAVLSFCHILSSVDEIHANTNNKTLE